VTSVAAGAVGVEHAGLESWGEWQQTLGDEPPRWVRLKCSAGRLGPTRHAIALVLCCPLIFLLRPCAGTACCCVAC
jgi:hypothetical protein